MTKQPDAFQQAGAVLERLYASDAESVRSDRPNPIPSYAQNDPADAAAVVLAAVLQVRAIDRQTTAIDRLTAAVGEVVKAIRGEDTPEQIAVMEAMGGKLAEATLKVLREPKPH